MATLTFQSWCTCSSKLRGHFLLQLVTEAGGSYLEAPVSGSKQPAEQGTLIFLCGGDESLYERSGPLLDVMGKAKFFLGKVIAGLRVLGCSLLRCAWQYRAASPPPLSAPLPCMCFCCRAPCLALYFSSFAFISTSIWLVCIIGAEILCDVGKLGR